KRRRRLVDGAAPGRGAEQLEGAGNGGHAELASLPAASRQLGHGALREHAALVDDPPGSVALLDLAEDVDREEEGDARSAVELEDERAQVGNPARIEAVRGLIEDDDPGGA